MLQDWQWVVGFGELAAAYSGTSAWLLRRQARRQPPPVPVPPAAGDPAQRYLRDAAQPSAILAQDTRESRYKTLVDFFTGQDGAVTPWPPPVVGTYAPRGKYRCDYCGRKCRKHIWNPSWKHPLSMEYSVCDDCIQYQDGHDDFTMWMQSDIVRL